MLPYYNYNLATSYIYCAGDWQKLDNDGMAPPTPIPASSVFHPDTDIILYIL